MTLSRPVLEHLPRLSLAALRRAPGQRVKVGPFIVTAYPDHANVNGQRIEFVSTSNHTGQIKRFKCPDCGQPRAHLYAGEPLTCRTCIGGAYEFNNLFYRHQQAEHVARRIRRRFAVITRTPYDRDALTFPPRPAWFPVKDYERMRGNHDELIERATVGYARQAGRHHQRKTEPRPLVRAHKYNPDAKAKREQKRQAERAAAVAAEIIAREKSERAIIDQQRERARRAAILAQYPIDPRG